MASEVLVNKLKLILKEIFQFDNNDLDFGIYRILNMKKKEIADFIEKELFEIIEKELKTLEDSQILKEKLEDLKKDIETLFGYSLEEAKEKNAQAPKIKEYSSIEEQLQSSEKESELEEELYNHIINFFSRYYDNGDFLSKRRYSKKNKYAIPYNGEEVYLYWTNHDQYYIKTSENFKNYSFKVDDATVEFTISNDEVELVKGNIKDIEKKFFIYHDLNYQETNKTLTIQFKYCGLTEEEENGIKKAVDKRGIKKEYVDTYNFKDISGRLEVNMIPKLKEKHIKMNGEPSELSELEWHLNKYTTKNTSDYFIQKDLKGFLSQELDFFIKNEIFHIDDLESRELISFNLLSIKVFKSISKKLIDFLAQIEEFQKKLWEKKKFVISTNYCITLDHIDKKYYPEILENKDQLLEWKKVFSFDLDKEVKRNKNKLDAILDDNSNPVSILNQNPFLIIDTKFFNEEFKYTILNNIDNLDDKINGILLNSDNFHGLNLISKKYQDKINTIYLDPPYNSKSSEIIYKNTFKHSSWLSLMENRLELAKRLINNESAIIVAIDENEQERLGLLLENLFPNHEKTCVTIVHNPRGIQGKNFSYCHEFAYFLIPEGYQLVGRKPIPKEDWKFSNLRAWGGESTRDTAKNCFYPIYTTNKEIIEIGDVPDEKFHPKHQTSKKNDMIEVWPIDENGIERKWRYVKQSLLKKLHATKVRIKKNGTVEIGIAQIDESYKTNWADPLYDAGTHGTRLLTNMGVLGFSFPKSIHTVKDCLEATLIDSKNSTILDFFAGSGTTGEAIIRINKEKDLNHKFILIEMGQYFNNVLKLRILKSIYSNKWKNGKPKENRGSNKQIIKYQILEQYEDSLNNINFLESNSKVKESKNYKIKYMLDYESKASNVFLNLDQLDNPFEYKIKIEDNHEIKEISIDLIETFNYIAGIYVNSIYMKKKDETTYIFVKGEREEKSVLVVWRNKPELFNPEQDKTFIENEIANDEYDEILINGNFLVKNAKSLDVIFKENMFR